MVHTSCWSPDYECYHTFDKHLEMICNNYNIIIKGPALINFRDRVLLVLIRNASADCIVIVCHILYPQILTDRAKLPNDGRLPLLKYMLVS